MLPTHGFSVIDSAEVAADDRCARRLKFGHKTPFHFDYQHFTDAVGGVDHFSGFGGGGRHRFFDQHVFAGVERSDGRGAVRGCRGTDADGVDRVECEQLAIIGKDLLYAPLSRGFARLALVDISDGD